MNPFLSKTQMTQLCVVASISMLIYYNSICRWYLTRSGTLTPNYSPWHQVHEIGDDVSLFNLTDFSREAFEEMNCYYYYYYYYYCINTIWKDIVLVVLDCSTTIMKNSGLSCFFGYFMTLGQRCLIIGCFVEFKIWMTENKV